jgi:hypothetical protein
LSLGLCPSSAVLPYISTVQCLPLLHLSTLAGSCAPGRPHSRQFTHGAGGGRGGYNGGQPSQQRQQQQQEVRRRYLHRPLRQVLVKFSFTLAVCGCFNYIFVDYQKLSYSLSLLALLYSILLRCLLVHTRPFLQRWTTAFRNLSFSKRSRRLIPPSKLSLPGTKAGWVLEAHNSLNKSLHPPKFPSRAG